jgi:hypothetical protein
MDAAEFPSTPPGCPAPSPGRCMRQAWRTPLGLRGGRNDRRLPLPVPVVPAAAFLEPGDGTGR